jgi:thioesterase domain-containing protein
MQRVQPSGPYVLGGYSFGGVVALEIAQQLVARGERVALLVLLDPPSLDPQRTPRGGSIRSVFNPAQPGTVVPHLRRLAGLRPAQYWSYILPRVVDRLASTVPALRLWSIRRIYSLCLRMGCRLPAFARKTYIFDIYDRARERYTPRPYSAPALLFKAASRSYGDSSDWEQMLTACEVRTLHATHRQMRSASHIHLWANDLRAALLSAL